MSSAGSINVKARMLSEEKWVVLTLAIGATLIAVVLIGLSMWLLSAASGVAVFSIALTVILETTQPTLMDTSIMVLRELLAAALMHELLRTED